MAKKLLNEAQVRRFMGLAGMQSNLVSNYLKEGGLYSEEDEDMADAEGEMAEEPPAEEPPAEAPEMDMGGEELPAEESPGEVDLSQDEIDAAAEAMSALQSVMDKLSGAAGDEEPEMDMGGEDLPAEEPEMDMGGEELPADEEGEEVLEGVELELSEDEVVAEVARRVAKRIMEAKRAQTKMNKALGRRRNTSRRRK